MNEDTELNEDSELAEDIGLSDGEDIADATILLTGKWENTDRSVGSAAILGLLGIGLIYFIGQTVVTILAVIPAVLTLDSDIATSGDIQQFLIEFVEELRVAIVISQYAFMLFPVIWFIRHWHTRDVAKYVRLNFRRPDAAFVAVLATLFIIPLGSYVAGRLSSGIESPDKMSEFAAELFTAHSIPEYAFLIFAIAITPAICEEIFFRGYIQRTLERVLGWRSFLIVGVLFGLFHLQPIGLIATTVLGILFGYFYYRTRSLLPSMLAHFANNALVVSLMYFRPTLGGVDLATSDVMPFKWVLYSLPIGIALLVLFHRMTRTKPNEILYSPVVAEVGDTGSVIAELADQKYAEPERGLTDQHSIEPGATVTGRKVPGTEENDSIDPHSEVSPSDVPPDDRL